MRVLAGLVVCILGAAAASAMPPSDDLLGNTMALKDSPSIAGRPDAAGPTGEIADQSIGKPELVAIMDKIEATGRMPKSAPPVSAYFRQYAWADIQRTKVTAVFQRTANPGRRWVDFDDLPMIDDGGCAVVELVYDVKTGGLDEIYCHGMG